jgi:hypothetical protein
MVHNVGCECPSGQATTLFWRDQGCSDCLSENNGCVRLSQGAASKH